MPCSLQARRRFEPEQAAADHDRAAPRDLAASSIALHVVEIAIGQHAGAACGPGTGMMIGSEPVAMISLS